MIFVVLLVCLAYTSIGHRGHIAMKYKGYKVSFKNWFEIVVLKKDISLNIVFFCSSFEHAIYMAGLSRVPKHALMIVGALDYVVLPTSYRFTWLARSESTIETIKNRPKHTGESRLLSDILYPENKLKTDGLSSDRGDFSKLRELRT